MRPQPQRPESDFMNVFRNLVRVAGVASACFVLSAPLQAATVIPVGDEVTEGNSNNGFPFNIEDFGRTSMRYQQIWDGDLFGTSTLSINSISFRIEGGRSSFGPVEFSDASLYFSTSNRTSVTMSSTFADNLGADNTLVASGFTLSGTGGGSPNPFDITIVFDTAFIYDPTAGALLMDVFVPSAKATEQFDATSAFLGTSREYGDVRDTVGSGSGNFGLIAAFDADAISAVPLPATLPLLIAGFGGLGLLARRKRNA